MPCPRSLHTLTCVGHACVLLGGSSALGALNEVHLLENPAITAGQVCTLHKGQGLKSSV